MARVSGRCYYLSAWWPRDCFLFADKPETIVILLNLIAEGKRLSGAERSAEMEHLIHFAEKVTS